MPTSTLRSLFWGPGAHDFKMLVVAAKTNTVSPDDGFVSSISRDGLCEAHVISHVASYKYLRVTQYLEPHRTT